MYMVYLRLPDFTPEEAVHVKLPSDIEEAKSLGRVIMVYRDTVRINYFFLWIKCLNLALLACFIIMDVCLCFYANVFNSWFNILLNSCRFYVALVSGTSSHLCCFWYWCITLFLTFKNSWPAIGETFRPRKGRAMEAKGQ